LAIIAGGHLGATYFAMRIRSRSLSCETTRLIEPVRATGAYSVELVDGNLLWRAPQGSGLGDAHTEPDVSPGLQLMLTLLGPFAPEEML
jgi:putative cardiolipin synthase